MKRRDVLGTGIGIVLAATSGCLGTVADAVARTRAEPAFAMPPVGTWRERAEGSASLRANNHNTTRSNRYQPVAGPTGDVTVEWTVSVTELRARLFATFESFPQRWYLPSRSGPESSLSKADAKRAFAYLDGEAVVGETFVLSVPSLDLPGVEDPTEAITPRDVIPTAGTFDGTGDANAPGTVIAELSALAGIADLVPLRPVDGTSPRLFEAVGRRSETGPLVVAWHPDRAASDPGAVSEPVVARATVTLGGGVRLPVLLYARRLRHEGDYLFVVGWVVDAGALNADAATVLVDVPRGAAPGQVVGVSATEFGRPTAPSSVVDGLDDRARMGSLVFSGPVTDDLRSFLPTQLREGEGLARFADVAARNSGGARAGEASAEAWLDALGGSDGGDGPHATVLNLDAPLVHLAAEGDTTRNTDSWVTAP